MGSARIDLVPASAAHIGTIAHRMRAIDRIECAAFGRTPKQALRLGLAGSVMVRTVIVDERAEAMFGLAPVSSIEGVATPWLLGTDAVYAQGRALIGLGPGIVAEMLDHAGRRLENRVSAANRRAIRLLRAWGFTVEPAVRTIGGHGFHDFWKER